jgi:hypothetical protein
VAQTFLPGNWKKDKTWILSNSLFYHTSIFNSLFDVGTVVTVFVRLLHSYFVFCIWEIDNIYQIHVTSKRQRCLEVAFYGRRKKSVAQL